MNSVHNEPFFQVPRTKIPTIHGEIEQPTMYYDVSMLMAMFTTDYDRAAEKLDGLYLKPGLFWRGKVVVGIIFYEYRDTSIGPYNEVGLGIPALPVNQSLPLGGWLEMNKSVEKHRLGNYVLNLPVTTEIACYGGREFFGYPKFVTEIPFHLDSRLERSFHGEVRDPNGGDAIVTLSGKLSSGIPGPSMSMVTYSVLNGKKLRTNIYVRGGGYMRGKGGLRLTVGTSDHEMARNLRDLGLHGRQPFMVMDTHRFQSRLNAAKEFDWTVK